MENQNLGTTPQNPLNTDASGQKNGMAVAGTVLGFIAFIGSFIPCMGLLAMLLGTVALIFGIVAYQQIKKTDGDMTLAYIALALAALTLAIEIFGWVSFGSSAYDKYQFFNNFR